MKIRKLNEWKCGISIEDADTTCDAPVVPDEMLAKLDADGKGWTYDSQKGYSFNGKVKVTDEFVRNGRLVLRFDHIEGDFDCSRIGLFSLEGCPTSVDGYFRCRHNRLKNLVGCPERVGGSFNCSHNQIISLKDSPKEVGGEFICCFNELTNLVGCTKTIGHNFDCRYNRLTSLNGCPEKVGVDRYSNFYCGEQKNEKVFTTDEVHKLCTIERGGVYV